MNKTPMQVDIQQWANENEPGDEMLYKKGYWTQILFVRDEIPSIFAADYEEYKAIRHTINVVSTHTSKSIKLPVFEVHLEKIGVTLILRYNFYDWKVTVLSDNPIRVDFDDLIAKTEDINPIFCEGFHVDWVYPSYAHDQQTFTVEINSLYKLHTFLWLIKQQLT